MLLHLPSIPTHPLLVVVCLLGNSLLRFTPMILRDLSFYYPDCNKEVIASESLQCITQLIASYYSVSLIVPATSSAIKKRQVDIERRAFNPAWRGKYFFYGALWTAQCLICLKTVSVLKEFNICDATGRQSIEHQTSGRCLLRRGKTPSIDCQATCRKQLRSSASKLLRPTR